MTIKKINIPEQKNYEISKEIALQAISLKKVEEIVYNTGGKLTSENLLTFNFYKFPVSFDLHSKELTIPDSIKSKSTEGLLLHYIAYSKGFKPNGNWCQFYQIKDASLYLPVFQKRTTQIINKAITNPEQFIQKTLNLGGREIEFISSARAFKFDAFPLFPLLIVFYEGDDEIPSEIKFLFDNNCINNLPAEDIVVLSQFLALQYFKA
jgi:hypothetical protein